MTRSPARRSRTSKTPSSTRSRPASSSSTATSPTVFWLLPGSWFPATRSKLRKRLPAVPGRTWCARLVPESADKGGLLVCSTCGTKNRPGRRFCAECGAVLAIACSSCGAANEPGDRFCGECGSPLGEGEVRPPRPATAQAERRHVSVLFADLVGFTSLSENRDPEEVRDLLSRYFDECSRLIGRYGGVVEKFIGDAVMAVWGTPVAQEDDAERAVRAGLDLTAAVAAVGGESRARGPRGHAGRLPGEAAVTLGAEGQGMVAGALVNTASRIQSVAEPGTVLVGETTKRASEAAIAYEDAAQHELKGKAEPVQLWRAVRVVAGAREAASSA